MTDDQLREAYAAHLRTRDPGTRADPAACVSPEDLLALVRREGPEPHRLAVLDHVMQCERCRTEFELLRAVEAAGRKADEADLAAPRDGAAAVRPLRPSGRR
ncbi:MAG TPA: hypothetical protein VGD56_03035, partial [Gemmatirosa sp.]